MMLMLSFLLVSSIVWGGLIWLSARALQRSNVSGRARQWIWRGATLLLLTPWVSAPLVYTFGWGLAPNTAPLAEEAVPASLLVEPAAFAPVADTVEISLAADPVAIDPVQVILLVLAAGWLVRFVFAQLAARSLLGIVAHAREARQGLARNALGAWSRRLGMRRPPRMLVVAENVSPFSFGMVRPTICMPEGLEERLKPEALDLVIAHECTHVARGDGWLRPLERIAADVLWFNPFAWLMRRELDVARELACDEAVVEAASDRRVYARTLRDIASFTACLPAAVPAASMSLAGGSLMLRVTRTLGLSDRKPARVALISACVLALVATPLAVAQVMLATPAPEAPEMPQAPPAPSVPDAPTPPLEESRVYVSSDGMVRISFAAKVTLVAENTTNGYSVSLLGTERSKSGEICVARLERLGGLSVERGQIISRGGAVGARGNGPSLSFEVQCTDEVDAQGQPVLGVAPAPPTPVARPASVSPTSAVAPIAAVPVVPATPSIAPPAPVSPPAAVAAPEAPEAPPTPHRLSNAPHAIIVEPVHLTSPYGQRPDPFNRQAVGFHDGLDLAGPRGTLVHAPKAGVVVFAGVRGNYGQVVEVDVGDGYSLLFAQLDEIKVRQGSAVTPGTVIGTMGSSGQATGPHLHLEVHKDGETVDPASVNGLVLVGKLRSDLQSGAEVQSAANVTRNGIDPNSALRQAEVRGMRGLIGGQTMLPPSTITQQSGFARARSHEPATQRNGYPRNLVVTRPN